MLYPTLLGAPVLLRRQPYADVFLYTLLFLPALLFKQKINRPEILRNGHLFFTFPNLLFHLTNP